MHRKQHLFFPIISDAEKGSRCANDTKASNFQVASGCAKIIHYPLETRFLNLCCHIFILPSKMTKSPIACSNFLNFFFFLDYQPPLAPPPPDRPPPKPPNPLPVENPPNVYHQPSFFLLVLRTLYAFDNTQSNPNPKSESDIP